MPKPTSLVKIVGGRKVTRYLPEAPKKEATATTAKKVMTKVPGPYRSGRKAKAPRKKARARKKRAGAKSSRKS